MIDSPASPITAAALHPRPVPVIAVAVVASAVAVAVAAALASVQELGPATGMHDHQFPSSRQLSISSQTTSLLLCPDVEHLCVPGRAQCRSRHCSKWDRS